MSHKILVVEDNPISRKMVRIALEAEGYTVVEAPDGKTALTLMIKHKPDLVLQDLRLPDVNGFDLVSQLREIPSAEDIPILALTGLSAKADELRLAAAPFTDYLFKPKIDKSFVTGLVGEPRSAAIVRSIIDLGRNLGMSVVAEGIENQATWDALGALGCDVGQGYHIARPMASADLASWLTQSPWTAKREG